MGGGCGATGITCTFWVGGSNAEKWGSLRKKKFFINNSVEALISFNEKHHETSCTFGVGNFMYLWGGWGGCSSERGKQGYLQKREFYLKRKSDM